MGALLAAGRDADVYALDAERVLRRYRAGGDVGFEAAIMRHVAEHGYPVPAVYAAEGPDLVLERLAGPTMAQALLAGDLAIDAGAAMLADLLDRLHAMPASDPALSVLHLDLHPQNVLLAARGPVVIDWRNAAEGPAELDVALSALILAQLVVAEAEPKAGELLDALLLRVGPAAARGIDGALTRRRRDPNLTDRELAELDSAAALVHARR
ncbi:MAG TPA: phosphotransferase [Jatrophihabitantaceae bacterium]